MSLLQIQFCSVLIVITCLVVSRLPGFHAADTRPNVVIIVADDLGIGDIGCFGNDTMQTPNIDRIAREGVKLTHHLTAAALCTPSRAALLTGRYPVRSGMVSPHVLRVNLFVSSTSGLPPSEITFAEVAKKNGYSTALIGKWHLGVNCEHRDDFCHHPLQQGFDYFYGLPLTNLKDFGNDGAKVASDHLQHMTQIVTAVSIGGFLLCFLLLKYKVMSWIGVCILITVPLIPVSVVFLVLTNIKFMNSIVMRNYEYVEQPIQFNNFTQRLVSEGVQFLVKQKETERPFLLMMSWIQVHTVLHTAEEFRGRSRHGAYGDNVEEMDWSVGQIVDALERLGFLNNTLVYFTSDNGGHLEEKGIHGDQEGGWNGIYRGGKGQGGMDGGIRVPTVAMWRGHIPAGSVIDVPTSLMDIFPTLSAAVWSTPLPSDRIIDGQNIYPLLAGHTTTPPHRFMVHYCGTAIHAVRYVPGNGDDVYKVYYVTPNWLPGTHQCAFICPCFGSGVTYHDPPLLYNIARDPSETRPLLVTDYTEIMEAVKLALDEHITSISSDIQSQFSVAKLVPRPWLQPCCSYPYCECSDPVYSPGSGK